MPPQIAAAIDRKRAECSPSKPLCELVDVIRSALPPQALREKQHPAKRSFQAIRIAVNDELGCRAPDAGGGHSPAEPRRTAGGDYASTLWRIGLSRRPCCIGG